MVDFIEELADTLVLRARGHAWDVPAVAVVALGLALLTTVWRRPFVCGTGAALSITIAHAALLWGGHGERALQSLRNARPELWAEDIGETPSGA